ncbi:MAG TPA: transcription-repair coupling factor [Tenuifilaceae bacterium]|nr:transcription-repair coupling factor [Tenuifilaceae bacterium]HPI45921.1 transcription-repair coupling factor [Tenuifilaceae bacterium]HPN20983.1 transcription-repair coupling factor [Tenuifilaceae bacterium]
MLDIKNIFQNIYSSPKSKELCTLLENKPVSIYLKGLSGSSVSFVAANVLQSLSTPNVIIVNDKEEAAYLFNDLSGILPEGVSYFFPSSFKRSVQYGQTLSEAIIQRTDVLNLLPILRDNPNKQAIIITYPDAIFEKVVTIDKLQKNSLYLKKGEEISPDFINDILHEYGFERVDFVYEPGQFSIRGSIVDIFSFSSANPYRLDFFGDEVETIRTFDVEDQLSKELLESIAIVPNLQEKIEDDEQKNLITDVLPENTIVWLKNPEIIIGRLNELFSIISQESQNNAQDLSRIYASGKDFMDSLKGKSTVEFGVKPLFRSNQIVEFSTSPQPPFNKNFELLADNLNENTLKGYTTYILADNPTQLERLENILHTINKELVYTSTSGTIHEGFVDHNLRICFYTDHQIFDRYHKYKLKHEFSRRDAITMQELINLQPGDYVVHIDHGIGVFGGLVSTIVNGKKQEAIRLTYQDNDTLLVNIHNLHKISKYRGKDAESPKIYKLGSGAWQKLKQNTKRKIKDIAKDLIALYAKRKTQAGFQFSPDSYLQQELEASFIYEDTPDQVKATAAVKEDMELDRPMDRLVCGDVGFGKTEVAVRAAFKAVADSKQVAVLVPTTILALQHYRTFSNRLKNLPCNIEFVSRMKTAAQQREIHQKITEGKIDILIGTHSLLKDSIKFKDLGLLVVDEEQKFGVAAKEKLKQLKLNVDTLTLTATPIPRTLQFSLMGARDLSIINTPPPNRHPILTELHTFNTDIIKEAIEYEVSRGGQVFFVHNRVQNIAEVQIMIHKICPKVKTAVAHGQMEPAKLEKIMLDFINGDYDVLVSTSIIESGLDISNANTIIINNAQMFGLSDLHQLRGRVGRSNKKAFCYLLAPPLETLTNDARRRLKAIEEFSELGSGFSIAMQDLDIRGAGNLLGGEQSGFIADIGFETYQRILDEALEELRETEFKDLYKSDPTHEHPKEWKPGTTDCHIETDMEILLPDSYVSNTAERIKLYRELDNISKSEELDKFKTELRDRFGTLPAQVEDLLSIVQLRWLAVSLGFEKIILKNEMLFGYFISNQLSSYYRSSIFMQIMQYIQRNPSRYKIKEGKEKLSLTITNIKNIDEAIYQMQQINNSLRLTES